MLVCGVFIPSDRLSRGWLLCALVTHLTMWPTSECSCLPCDSWDATSSLTLLIMRSGRRTERDCLTGGKGKKAKVLLVGWNQRYRKWAADRVIGEVKSGEGGSLKWNKSKTGTFRGVDGNFCTFLKEQKVFVQWITNVELTHKCHMLIWTFSQ